MRGHGQALLLLCVALESCVLAFESSPGPAVDAPRDAGRGEANTRDRMPPDRRDLAPADRVVKQDLLTLRDGRGPCALFAKWSCGSTFQTCTAQCEDRKMQCTVAMSVTCTCTVGTGTPTSCLSPPFASSCQACANAFAIGCCNPP